MATFDMNGLRGKAVPPVTTGREPFPNEKLPRRLTIAELESRVPAGSASRPIAKFAYRLCAPLRWWSRSILRIVAIELCSLPLRILAILKQPSLPQGVPIPLDLGGWNPANPEIASSYIHACSLGMQQLQSERRMLSALETQTYVRAFRQGATWGIHNACSGSNTQAAQQDSSGSPPGRDITARIESEAIHR